MKKLRNEIREFYKKFYESNDGAHQIDHADEVCDLMLKMNTEMNLKIDDVLIYFAAYIHDIYSDQFGRAKHHKLAAEYVLTSDDAILDSLSNAAKETISNAVLEHRGSYTGKFSSILSELISSADRGYLDFDKMIQRSLKFHRKAGMEEEVAMREVEKHMIEKFGRNGYAKFPVLYLKYFGDSFEELYDKIENM